MGAEILLLAVSFTHLTAHVSNSPFRCLVEPESIERDFKWSAAVFLGEVVELKNTEGLKEAHLRVSRVWKGLADVEVTVFEPANSAESPHYRVGISYLVFAGVRDGKLFTGACSRTKPAASAQRDLRQLGKGQKPKMDADNPATNF
jgi:hypothetical protein